MHIQTINFKIRQLILKKKKPATTSRHDRRSMRGRATGTKFSSWTVYVFYAKWREVGHLRPSQSPKMGR